MGIRLLNVEELLKEAMFTTDYVDFEFETSKEVAVGIYGARSAKYIIELGFVVLDLDCLAKAQSASTDQQQK